MKEREESHFLNNINPNDFFDYSELGSNISTFNEKITPHETENFETTTEMKNSDYLVSFSTQTQSYCVGLVDMVNSTKISATIGSGKISRYYQIFLNSMSRILGRFGGFVIKNIGDSLVYYFPESSKKNTKYGFMSCLECSLAMIEARSFINERLIREKLPCLDYRVSADYGSVIIMKSDTSDSLDMIGPPVNMCSKINRLTPSNGIVVGSDLYEMVKDFNGYQFKRISEYSMGFKLSYPVYSLNRKC